jgi:hypothetical protein
MTVLGLAFVTLAAMVYRPLFGRRVVTRSRKRQPKAT